MDDFLDPISGMDAQIWVRPSRGQLFWLRHAPRMFAPALDGGSAFVRWWAIATVTPSTNVTGLNLPYQAYLDAVFHRTRLARVGHAICMPIIVASWLALLVPVRVDGISLAPVVAALLAVWWGVWALVWRDAWWGLCSVLLAGGLYASAATVMAARPHTGGWAWSPVVWVLLASLLQASSHAQEPLPPRVTRSAAWIPVDRYLLGAPGNRHSAGTVVRRLGHLMAQTLFGTVGELFSAPRLLPVLLLRFLWFTGHDATRRGEALDRVRLAVASGNPALDYIGIGGCTPLRTRTPVGSVA